jgi:GT2 family glycosyltransferase
LRPSPVTLPPEFSPPPGAGRLVADARARLSGPHHSPQIPRSWTAGIAATVVIPTLGAGALREALVSLAASDTDFDFEVVVVDNGSPPGAVPEAVPGLTPRVIRFAENRGWGAAINAGFAAARGEVLLVLNDDATVHPQWLAEMVDAATPAGPQRGGGGAVIGRGVGMVASLVLNASAREQVDNTGHLLAPDGLNRGRHRLLRRADLPAGLTTALLPSGCAALYRREPLAELGGFDERFFAYGDDCELGLRLRLAGWGCAFAPRALVWHGYSATTGAYSPAKAYLVERNRLFVLAKYFPAQVWGAGVAFDLRRYALSAQGAATGQGLAARARESYGVMPLVEAIALAHADAVRAAPGLWAERRRLDPLVDRSLVPALLKEYPLTAEAAALSD